jgi:hypothetical protein
VDQDIHGKLEGVKVEAHGDDTTTVGKNFEDSSVAHNHLIIDELFDAVKIPRGHDGVIVLSLGKLFPKLDIRAAEAEEHLHVEWSKGISMDWRRTWEMRTERSHRSSR